MGSRIIDLALASARREESASGLAGSSAGGHGGGERQAALSGLDLGPSGGEGGSGMPAAPTHVGLGFQVKDACWNVNVKN